MDRSSIRDEWTHLQIDSLKKKLSRINSVTREFISILAFHLLAWAFTCSLAYSFADTHIYKFVCIFTRLLKHLGARLLT